MNTFSEGTWDTRFQVQAFQYPHVGEMLAAEDPVACGDEAGPDQREQDARSEGLREGEARARREYEQALKREREAIKTTIEDFQRERDRYYQQVESEVVQLALAIARKVLHRESQVDPLLLAGIVRVAVRKLESGTHVKVVVNPAEAQAWRKNLNDLFEAEPVPALEESDAVAPRRCVLQTELGMTELGVEPQLKEIENGLFDLLAKRPKVRG